MSDENTTRIARAKNTYHDIKEADGSAKDLLSVLGEILSMLIIVAQKEEN